MLGLTERLSSTTVGDRAGSDSENEIFGGVGCAQNPLFLECKARSSCRALRDATNELAYTIYIGISLVITFA